MTRVTRVEGKHRGQILLGRRGENLAGAIAFELDDFLAAFGQGTAQLLHQRCGDAVPYVPELVREGDTVTWVLSSDDTARQGYGRAELRWYVGEVLAKSRVWDTVVFPALEEPETLPSEQKTALELLADRVESAAEDVAAARAAKTAAQAAQAAAETARGAAQEAAGNAALSAAAAHTDALGAAGSAETAADKALSAATDAGVAEEAAGEAAESAEAAECARDAAQSARSGAEAAQAAAAGSAGAAAQSAQGASGSAAAANGAKEAAEAARDAAAQKAGEAVQSAEEAAAARTAAETAQGEAEQSAQSAAQSAEGAEVTREYVDGHYSDLAASPTEASGQELLAAEESNTFLVGKFLASLDGLTDGLIQQVRAEVAALPQDESGQAIAAQLNEGNSYLAQLLREAPGIGGD